MTVAATPLYVSRLVRLGLLERDGTEVGSIADVVLGAPEPGEAPPVHGFVVAVRHHRVFVGAGRVGELGPDGARLRRGTINMRRFETRPGEALVVAELFGRRVEGERVVDVGISAAEGAAAGWAATTVALAQGGRLAVRRRPPRIVPWAEAGPLVELPYVARQAAVFGSQHPADMARAIRALPLERRRVLAGALQDERLADLLEELSEEEQVRIVEGLDLERTASVLDEMEADDAADLLGELSARRRGQLLEAMTPEEAAPVRRLLAYDADTAGGLMTPEPVVLPPDATVAEALARVRDPDLPAALAAQVFVARPPSETPTGRYLGHVGCQRLLREAPSRPLARCLDEEPQPVPAGLPEAEVAARLAAYDALVLGVLDDDDRLLGAVTIDDVLDRVLPVGWREG